MKYIKGNQTVTLKDCNLCKVRLKDNEDFSETPWAKQLPEGSGFVLQNHALAFTPWPSWGAVIPTQTFVFTDMLEKQELILHPEAYNRYLEDKIIDENGNGLKMLEFS